MPAFKNILFDLGDVLIDIDFQKVKSAFENLGITEFDKQFSQFTASSLFENLETGKISETAFYTAIQQQSTIPLADIDIKNAWNAILLDFRAESMKRLQELKQTHRLFLLSNTNAIHLTEVNNILQKQLGINNLDVFFEKAYYSHVVGLRKPYRQVFDFVLKDAGIVASETMFIDDTPPNIETAGQLGFSTHLLQKGERIETMTF
jgi:putative hydrolase of the HAD superfamily